MKNATLFLGLVLLITLPTACSDDALMESMELASRTDNNMVLDGDLDFERELKLELELDPNMDLSSPFLKKRVEELRDSIETFMGPEFDLMMTLGRRILRDRGIDPDTAFGFGAEDPRLAMIPFAADVMDKLNQRFERRGYHIVDIYGPEDTARTGDRTPTGIDTQGPWGDYWPEDEDDTMLHATEDDINECFGKILGEVGGMVGLANGILGKASGRALISFVGGATILTLGKGIAVAGILYGSYRMGKCLDQKQQDRKNEVTCSITMSLEDYYRRIIEDESSTSEEIADARMQLQLLFMKKFGGLVVRIGDDTLTLAVSPDYKTESNWNDVIIKRK